LSNFCHFFPLSATIIDKQMTSTMTSVFSAFLCASARTLLARTIEEKVKTDKILTSIFDSHVLVDMAGCTLLARILNKINSFRFFPASPLLSNDSPNTGYNLTVTPSMAHSLGFKSVTSKSPIL